MTTPRVVPVPDGYQIVFLELTPGGDAQVTTVRIGFDATLQSVTNTPAGFAHGLHASDGTLFFFDSLWAVRNGAAAVVMWGERSRELPWVAEPVVAPLQADGSVGPTTLLSKSLPIQHMRKLLPVNGVVAGVWTEQAPNQHVVVGRFTPDGMPLDGAGLRLTESLYDQVNCAAASDGEQLFVVWRESNTLYGAFVRLGSPLFASVPRILTKEVASLDPRFTQDDSLAVVWNGATFTVVFGHNDDLDDGRLDLAALRVDRLGNVVDPAPISITRASGDSSSEAANPRLSSNGSSYLVTWQRRSITYGLYGDSAGYSSVNMLLAQRVTASLVAEGAEIPLDTVAYDTFSIDLDVEDSELAVSNGVWLASWLSYRGSRPPATRFARIENREVPYASSAPLLAPVSDGWMVLTGVDVLSFVKIGLDGTVSLPWTTPSGQRVAEAFAVAPHPLVAYKRTTDAYLAYIDEIAAADHRRSVGHP